MVFRTLAYAATLFIAGPLLAEDLTVGTARGPKEVPLSPETVAVFDVAAVDTLSALEVPVAGTLNSLYVDYLGETEASAVDLGTFWEPDLEALHALAPDLIVVGTRSADQVKLLSRIAPAIDMTVGYDTVTEGLARLEAYGEIFGRQNRAASLKANFEARLAQAKAAAEGKGTALVIMTNGPKISAFGTGGRFGWLHTSVGLPEAAPEIGASIHGESVSFEFIRDKNPDWLIVVDRLAAIGRPGESAAATLDSVLVQGTKAWGAGQVIYLNPADIYIAGGGIQSMNRTLDQLIAGFIGS
ncbi:siderophore ABC transporter substrate-binding protein [Phaeobacter sp.]|uniref:siderophore ABC transporter substrate-binding protein n=1 Tax=Phaeobacter sp. TaxID=1902409 RepID=UPI0025F5458B|nr:siderophore ABC transporter substrate-binding protein [Phaeobacter sp.]